MKGRRARTDRKRMLDPKAPGEGGLKGMNLWTRRQPTRSQNLDRGIDFGVADRGPVKGDWVVREFGHWAAPVDEGGRRLWSPVPQVNGTRVL
jgi:hypothetical protein